jgi:UDP-N-acetyl-D-galactosamine dehydrogenase
MGAYVAQRVVKMMTQRGIPVAGSNVLILGLAFKENCPDIRNTRSIDLVREFVGYNAHVDVYDPWVDPGDALHEYGIALTPQLTEGKYDAMVLAVSHKQFAQMTPAAIRALGKPGKNVLFDVKAMLPRDAVDDRL